MELGWKFPSAMGGQEVGLNNGDIETFKDKPIRYLAREAVQNSLDASVDDKPVRVCFKTFKLKNDRFPDREGLLKALNGGRAKWSHIPDAKEFFDYAINVLNNEEIDFLRISDFNTCGLTGSENNTGHWHDLVNSTGVSAKEGNKSGSHGIGKNAPFACSYLRTVFYNTLDIHGNTASKGVSKLASYVLGENADGSKNESQPTGFYGLYNDYKIDNINEQLVLDPDFNRVEAGTDVYVAGFRQDFFKEKYLLQAAIISGIIDSFLIAFWNNKLIVEVDDVVISKETLEKVIEQYQKQIDKTTVMVFNMLKEGPEWIELPFEDVSGSIKLAIKLDKEANNKISMYRNSGMKIFDDSNRCSTLRYVGIAIIEGDELNSYLRKLENASHSKWEPNRYKPDISRELLSKLFKLISNALNEKAEQYQGEESDIDKASDYLPDDIQQDDQKEESKKINQNLNKLISIERKVYSKINTSASMGTTIIDDQMITQNKGEVGTNGKEGGQAYLNLGNKKKKKGFRDPEPANTNTGNTNTGNKDINVKAKQIRVFCTNKQTQSYRFMFTPDITNNDCYIEFYKIAEMTEKEPLIIEKIISSSQENVDFKNNKLINISFVENVPIILDLQFLNKEYFTMEVKMYAHKE